MIERSERMAVIVLPREPVVDWANSIDADDPTWAEDIADRANVYFIPNFDTLDEAEAHLRVNFDEIFCSELGEWFEDEALWPKERTYEMFVEWFDVLYDVVVFDTQPRRFPGHRN